MGRLRETSVYPSRCLAVGYRAFRPGWLVVRLPLPLYDLWAYRLCGALRRIFSIFGPFFRLYGIPWLAYGWLLRRFRRRRFRQRYGFRFGQVRGIMSLTWRSFVA